MTDTPIDDAEAFVSSGAFDEAWTPPQAARFLTNKPTWDRIVELLGLPDHGRIAPLELRTDEAGVVWADISIMLTPDELVGLAQIAAGT